MRITKNILPLSFVAGLMFSLASCAELTKNGEDKKSASDSDPDKKEVPNPYVEKNTGLDLETKQSLFTDNTVELTDEETEDKQISEDDLSPNVKLFCELMRRQMAMTANEADEEEYTSIIARLEELRNDTTRLSEKDKTVLSNHMHQMYNDEMLENSAQSKRLDENAAELYKTEIHNTIDIAVSESETLGDFIKSF